MGKGMEERVKNMKRSFVLLIVLLLCALLGMPALAEGAPQRLEMAFGLFSVEAPAQAEIVPSPGNLFSDLRCELGGGRLVYANFAPADAYEDTAKRKLNSCVSMMFALSGGAYSETEIAEERLPNGAQLRWQIMRGSAAHTLWFEAFTERFGYNMVITGPATEAQDQAALAMMRSFCADADREQALLESRQIPLPGGAFISVEHGLQLQLDESWQPVMMEELLRSDSAFILEKDGGRWLIQLMYTLPVDPEDARSLLDWYANLRSTYYGAAVGEPYAVTLEHLGGAEAWIAEERGGVCALDIAFVHQGYGYYGSLMWIPQDEAEARPFMEAAIQSLTTPET